MTKARFRFPRKGFKRHHGGPRPVGADQYVEAIVRTAEGFGSSGVIRADRQQWEMDANPEEAGLGVVVGYRLAECGEEPRFGPLERF